MWHTLAVSVKLHQVCVSVILQVLNTTEFNLKLSIAYPRSEMFKLNTLTWISQIGLLLFKQYEVCGSASAWM